MPHLSVRKIQIIIKLATINVLGQLNDILDLKKRFDETLKN